MRREDQEEERMVGEKGGIKEGLRGSGVEWRLEGREGLRCSREGMKGEGGEGGWGEKGCVNGELVGRKSLT